MSDDSNSDTTSSQPDYSFSDEASRREWIPVCSSSLDLLNRTPLLCRDVLREVELPDGKHILDQYSVSGYLMSPDQDLQSVATAGRLIGTTFNSLASSPSTAVSAVPFLATALGVTLGHAGVFDYQREGNAISGYVQHREYRDVSNFNIGLLAQQAGIPERVVLYLSGLYALALSSNAMPREPYFQDPRNVQFIHAGYVNGRSGVFNPQKSGLPESRELPRAP